MISRHRLAPGLVVLALACSRTGESDRTEAAGEPAQGSSSTDVMFSLAQVQHGGVRWAPALQASVRGMTSAEALPGQLVPDEDHTARLGAPAGGRVLSVSVSPGERVEAGRVLVTLASPGAAMAQSDLAKAAAVVSSRRAQAAYARAARERANRLLLLKAIPRQEVEKAVADDELARSELTQAEAEQARAQATAAALGAIGHAAGELAIRAPSAGVVLERLAVPGAVVEPGTPLVVITDTRTLWLTLDAPEGLAGALRVGAAVRFVVPAFPFDTVMVRVTAVAAGLDPATRTLAARATVPNPAGRLKPAMLATVFPPAPATARNAPQAIVLPDSAVQLVDGVPTVFFAMPDDKGGAHLMARRVELGARAGNQVVVLRGVAAGDLVVVAGAFAVKAELKKAASPKMEM
ncbi:MAG: efflux RND transporter periplasmic adaptor subunit [Gemmatimonadales bacterium]|nr:efflux RND transporter periplasmic adaptor subunit [Gemmatimonadales bacterium]